MSERYEFAVPKYGVVFTAERLRREHNELHGELSVKCSLAGAKTTNGYLSTGDFNFSGQNTKRDRAKFLTLRSGTNGEIDWLDLLEDFCQRVFAAEREGDPSVDLRTMARATHDDFVLEGLAFPKRHPSILFGDGGTGKSYIALWIAGRLAHSGIKVALFDWELTGEDHRDRLERIFGDNMPLIEYVRCDRPLSAEADRLGRVVREKKIVYAFYDSVAFACDGRPEDAEVAGRYFRAVRQIECGSLHIAHVNKSEDNDRKPFGSSFWHNGARCTWYVARASENDTEGDMRLGFWNRKANLGPLRSETSLGVKFTADSTIFSRIEIAETEEFAQKVSVRKRMLSALRNCPLTAEQIATEIDAELETVKRTIRRSRSWFVVLEGGKVGIVDRNMPEPGQFARTV